MRKNPRVKVWRKIALIEYITARSIKAVTGFLRRVDNFMIGKDAFHIVSARDILLGNGGARAICTDHQMRAHAL